MNNEGGRRGSLPVPSLPLTVTLVAVCPRTASAWVCCEPPRDETRWGPVRGVAAAGPLGPAVGQLEDPPRRSRWRRSLRLAVALWRGSLTSPFCLAATASGR